MKKNDLSYLVDMDAPFEVSVTPKASYNQVKIDGTVIRVYVTTVPEGGKATDAVVKLLSKAIGVSKSKLKLLRGAKTKQKLFVIED